MIDTKLVLVVSALIFSIGLYGALSRRNAIGILMCVELMLNACNLNLVAFARLHGIPLGQTFALFVIALAGAAVVVGLAIVILVYKQSEDINVDRFNLMKW
ncbi:NADH-quinone oxidoreductase subunit NuoK [bacterium]|nr:NADH-quinone oxidoreductase subunit NuoK [bacterium]